MMKVLFVSSANSNNGVSPIVKNQAESLERHGVGIDYFLIKGKGIIGYLNAAFELKKYIRNKHFDIIHAHYSFSAIVATLSGAKSIVVSLMGSDVKSSWFYRIILFLFIRFFWQITIVKSEDMKTVLGINNIKVIPNGVDIDRFKEMDKDICQKKLLWSSHKKNILFAAQPNRPEKNFELTKLACSALNDVEYDLHTLENIPNELVPQYYNAADVVVLTSKREGSPNVIKEAMACNRKVIATNVGDIEWLFGNVKSLRLVENNIESVSRAISSSLSFNEKVNSRNRIIELGLDSNSVADKILCIYNNLIKIQN